MIRNQLNASTCRDTVVYLQVLKKVNRGNTALIQAFERADKFFQASGQYGEPMGLRAGIQVMVVIVILFLW